MSLHRELAGEGPDLVLLHGWGLHGGLWAPLVGELADAHRCHALDLPGHGRSPWGRGCGDLEGLARRVAEHLPERCDLLGWSLGGMVALRIATLFPARVRLLVLVATTPCFVARRDWPHGMEEETLRGFAASLQRDWRRTVQEFLGLQVRGDEKQLETLRELRRVVFEHGEPSTGALAAGLEILRTADLRAELARVQAPALVVAGEYDRLTPPGAGAALAAALPRAEHWCAPRAAHAPFLSHRAEFARRVRAFLGAAAASSPSAASSSPSPSPSPTS